MRFRTIALFGKTQSTAIEPTIRLLAEYLTTQDYRVLYDGDLSRFSSVKNTEPAAVEEITEAADLAIVVGGDGTMLGVARQLAPHNIPLIGVNQGRLGFMTDLSADTVIQQLEPMLAGEFMRETRALLHADVKRRNTTVYSAPALNDVVVSRGVYGRMVEIEVFIDGAYMFTQRADGFIIATPTGSTAYALSVHGPIMAPGLQGIVLCPVASQALSSRPIVLPDSVTIEIRVMDGAGTSLHCDMQSLTALADEDRIVVRQSPDRLTLLHPLDYDYFDMLRKKLHWSANPTVAPRNS